MKPEVLECARQIAEIERKLNRLREERESLHKNGDKAGERDVTLQIEHYEDLLHKKNKEFDALMKKIREEAVLQAQRREYWEGKVCELLCRKCDLMELWIQKHPENNFNS